MVFMEINQSLFGVIMAGGGGTRLWPFSTSDRPKQFLDLCGGGQSLLQMTFRRLSQRILPEHILIVTNLAYRPIVLAQLPFCASEQVLCEPCRRNTAPCIAYATTHILAQARNEGLSQQDVTMVVCPSDHYIPDEETYLDNISTAVSFAQTHGGLVTLGITPTSPHTGYGYIHKGGEVVDSPFYSVACFTEKPDAFTAEQFLQSKEYLWNAGIFVWTLPTILTALRQYLPKLLPLFEPGLSVMCTDKEQSFIDNAFPRCEDISIDYGLLEKSDAVYVLPVSFSWSDLGSWETIYSLNGKDENGNVTLVGSCEYIDSTNNMVLVGEGITTPVRLQNTHNMVVVQTDAGVLVRPLASLPS